MSVREHRRAEAQKGATEDCTASVILQTCHEVRVTRATASIGRALKS